MAKVRYTSMHLIQSLHIGAKTLLSHFHLICKGQKPFELDWSVAGAEKPVQRMARVSSEEAAFLNRLSHTVQKKGTYPLGSNVTEWGSGSTLTPNLSLVFFRAHAHRPLRGEPLVHRAVVCAGVGATQNTRGISACGYHYVQVLTKRVACVIYCPLTVVCYKA
jgi:hypothetical protein